MTQDDSVTALFDATAFDIVIKNAGIAGGGAALDMPRDEFQQVIDTNLSGAFAVAQVAVVQLSKALAHEWA